MAADSLPAEQSLLGGLLIDSLAWDRVAAVLAAVDFEVHAHRVIWRTIEQLVANRKPVDVVTVAEAMDADGRLDECGGLAYLVDLRSGVPSTANLEIYARLVHDRACLRHLGALCRDVARQCEDSKGRGADDLAMEAETRIHRLAAAKTVVQDLSPLKDVLIEALRYADSRASGEVSTISTGLTHLDRMTGGLLRGSLNVLAARPSQGKTALGLAVALGAVNAGRKVAFFSLEMPAWQVGLRLLAMTGGVPVQAMLRAELDEQGWDRLTAQVSRLQDTGLYVADGSQLSAPALRAMVSRQKRLTGLDLVVVDYLQLMEPPKLESREQQVAALSKALKSVAKEFDVAVLCLAQLNRDAAGRRPRMSDIRESGAVEQDADLVMLIHREDKDGVPADEVELILDKNRNGETGAVRLAWVADCTRFEDFGAARYSGPREVVL